MASPGVGAKGFIGFGPEDTWGTAATITRYIEFLSESVKRNQSGVVSNGIQHYRGATSYKKTTIAPGGDINFEVNPEHIPTLIYHAFGKVTTSTVSGGYSHLIVPYIDLPEGLTFLIDRDKAYFLYEGGKINSLNMSFSPNEIITGSVSILAKSETATLGAYSASPSYPTAPPFSGVEAAVTINTGAGYSSQPVMSADFTLNNNLYGDKYELGNNDRQALIEQRRSVTGKINIEFDDLDIYTLFVNGSESALKITMTSDTSPYAMTIEFPEIVYTGETPTMGGPDIITVDCPFTALYTSAASPEIIITVINTETVITG